MTRAWYYASTVRNLKDVVQYAVYPVIKLAAFIHFRDEHKANIAASVASTGFYSALTTGYTGIESGILDQNARRAVAAEMGKAPEELKFSDYLDSQNCIVKREMADLQHVQKLRYATDALFLIPAAMHFASKTFPGFKPIHDARANSISRKDLRNASIPQIMTHGLNLWDNAIYGGKAAYWAYETFGIPKTAHYEIVKVFENIESVGKKFTANDVIAIVNRAREDKGQTILNEKTERPIMWPIMEKLAEKLNSSERFTMPELVYLIGMNKINIFALDEQGNECKDAKTGKRIISQKAVQDSLAEIERVDKLGLEGIGRENRHAALAFQNGDARMRTQIGASIPAYVLRQQEQMKAQAECATGQQVGMPDMPRKGGFADSFRRGALDMQFDLMSRLYPGKKGQTEYISPRDPDAMPSYLP